MMFLRITFCILISQIVFIHAMETALTKPNTSTIKLYKKYKILTPFKINKLLDKGADVNYTPNKRRPTLLMFATRQDVFSMQLLLKYGADVNTIVNGRTALDWAIEEGNLSKIKYLLKRNPNKCCLGHALIKQDIPIINAILKKNERKDSLFSMKSVILSASEDHNIATQMFGIAKCFLQKNIFEHTMFITPLKKLFKNPFNDHAMDLLVLFCNYGKFSYVALQLAEEALCRATIEERSYKHTVSFTHDSIQSYMFNTQLKKQLKKIIHLIKKNEPFHG